MNSAITTAKVIIDINENLSVSKQNIEAMLLDQDILEATVEQKMNFVLNEVCSLTGTQCYKYAEKILNSVITTTAGILGTQYMVEHKDFYVKLATIKLLKYSSKGSDDHETYAKLVDECIVYNESNINNTALAYKLHTNKLMILLSPYDQNNLELLKTVTTKTESLKVEYDLIADHKHEINI